MLSSIQLPHPADYPFVPQNELECYVEETPDEFTDYAIVDDDLVITRGVPIDVIFLGFKFDDFYQPAPG